MDRRTMLLAVAFGFALVSAVSHLVLGGIGSVEWLLEGSADLLGPLFLLAAVLVVALVVSFLGSTVAPPAIYAVGAVLMFAHLIAYADWHAFGVAESVLGLEDHGHDHDHADDHSHEDDHSHDDGHNQDDDHSHGDDHNGHAHDGSAHEVLIDHLRADAIALVTKVSEAVSMFAFVALYVLER